MSPARGASGPWRAGWANWWAAGALALAAGCSDPKLERLTEARDAACRCKDQACVAAALAKVPADPPREARRAQRLAHEIMDCVAKVGLAEEAPLEAPGPPPTESAPTPAEAQPTPAPAEAPPAR